MSTATATVRDLLGAEAEDLLSHESVLPAVCENC